MIRIDDVVITLSNCPAVPDVFQRAATRGVPLMLSAYVLEIKQNDDQTVTAVLRFSGQPLLIINNLKDGQPFP